MLPRCPWVNVTHSSHDILFHQNLDEDSLCACVIYSTVRSLKAVHTHPHTRLRRHVQDNYHDVLSQERVWTAGYCNRLLNTDVWQIEHCLVILIKRSHLCWKNKYRTQWHATGGRIRDWGKVSWDSLGNWLIEFIWLCDCWPFVVFTLCVNAPWIFLDNFCHQESVNLQTNSFFLSNNCIVLLTLVSWPVTFS